MTTKARTVFTSTFVLALAVVGIVVGVYYGSGQAAADDKDRDLTSSSVHRMTDASAVLPSLTKRPMVENDVQHSGVICLLVDTLKRLDSLPASGLGYIGPLGGASAPSPAYDDMRATSSH